MHSGKLIITLILLIVFSLPCSGNELDYGAKTEKMEVADSSSVPSLEWLGKGRKLMAEGKYEQAVDCFNKSISIDPGDAEVYYCKGNALRDLKRYDEAIKSYDKALEIAPEFTMALMEKGKILYLQGKYKNAIQCYDKLLSIDSTYPYAKQEKEKAAKALYGENYILPENTADYWVEKGNNSYKEGKYSDAAGCYDRALQIDGANIRAQYNKGNCLYILKKYRDALTCYETVLKIDPNNVNAKNYRDKCLKALGESK
mgnify:CR=1 FL=1